MTGSSRKPPTRSIHLPAARAARRDMVVHVVTDENQALYTVECAKACALPIRPGLTARTAEMIVPTLSRPNGRWLPGDVMLIAMDASLGEVRGAARLSSTIGPSERYGTLATYAPGTVQRSGTILHWDGLHISSIRNGTEALSSAPAALLAGIQSFALKADIEQLTAVVDMSWLSQLLDLGWNPVPLGLPREQNTSAAIAVLLDINEVALRRTRHILSVAGPVIIRRGLSRRPPPGPAEPKFFC